MSEADGPKTTMSNDMRDEADRADVQASAPAQIPLIMPQSNPADQAHNLAAQVYNAAIDWEVTGDPERLRYMQNLLKQCFPDLFLPVAKKINLCNLLDGKFHATQEQYEAAMAEIKELWPDIPPNYITDLTFLQRVSQGLGSTGTIVEYRYARVFLVQCASGFKQHLRWISKDLDDDAVNKIVTEAIQDTLLGIGKGAPP